MYAFNWSSQGPNPTEPNPTTQLAGKALGTTGLAEVLVVVHRQHQHQQQQHQQRRRQQDGQPAIMALDASSNGLEALPLLAPPEARLILHGLTELRLAHNSLQGDLAAFASLRRLVHLGALRERF
jgi:hypothetical protein